MRNNSTNTTKNDACEGVVFYVLRERAPVYTDALSRKNKSDMRIS